MNTFFEADFRQSEVICHQAAPNAQTRWQQIQAAGASKFPDGPSKKPMMRRRWSNKMPEVSPIFKWLRYARHRTLTLLVDLSTSGSEFPAPSPERSEIVTVMWHLKLSADAFCFFCVSVRSYCHWQNWLPPSRSWIFTGHGPDASAVFTVRVPTFPHTGLTRPKPIFETAHPRLEMVEVTYLCGASGVEQFPFAARACIYLISWLPGLWDGARFLRFRYSV